MDQYTSLGVIMVVVYLIVTVYSAPTTPASETKMCQSCDLYCMSSHNDTSDICSECQCEPPKQEFQQPREGTRFYHYCYFRKCPKPCPKKGFKLNENGCPTCDCIV